MPAQIDRRYFSTRPGRAVARLLSYALFEGRPLTTRGRWINPLVFAHFAVEKRLPALKRVTKPVFILGTGRSGTTILGVVLSMHRQVGFLNEPKALWHAVHPGEDVIGNYTRGPGRYRLGAQDAGPQAVRAARRLFGAYLFLTGSSRLVDKYPELVFRVPFVRAIFPDARFVFLMRSGYDTCRSIERWSRRNASGEGAGACDWWGAGRRKWALIQSELLAADPVYAGLREAAGRMDSERDMAAVEWLVTMREGLKALDEHPGAVLPVRYEELAGNPRRELSRIADFAGLAPDPVFLGYGESVLEPAAPAGRFELDPAVRPLFEETMQRLGY